MAVMDPLQALQWADLGAQLSEAHDLTDKTDSIPDPIQMVLDERYLSRPNLYPRQATILKIIFLRDDLFTDYDRAVIDSWTQEFVLPPDVDKPRAEDDPLRYIPAGPDHGLAPDIYERIAILKAQGRKWFKEVLPVIGRRGGKGYIGGLCGAIVLWHYLRRGDPQSHYGVMSDKGLGMYVFSGKRDQAKVNQWRDIVNVILGAPCYEGYISRSSGEVLSVFAPINRMTQREFQARGLKTDMDLATFQILPKESTPTAGRGPALFALYFDEMAHVSTSAGAASSAEDVYTAATPALDQFGEDALIYCGSSPWQMMGQFYTLCQQALEIEPDGEGGFRPVYPDKLLIQLCSWDPYEDWERAHEIPLVPESYARALAAGKIPHRAPDDFYLNPDGSVRTFLRIKRPIQVYDEAMEKLERANPETFAVERRSQWQASQNAYLNPKQVDEFFAPFVILPQTDPAMDPFLVEALHRGLEAEPRVLTMQSNGALSQMYVAHGDPSTSGANFAWGIAHAEGPDIDGLYHVVFDQLHVWRPSDFEGGRIDYLVVQEEILRRVDAFMPELVTFDQFNSASLMAHIRKHVREQNYPKRVTVSERTATAPMNWAMAETFKTAMNMRLVHAPPHELASLELKFLQLTGRKVDHPSEGPVQTSDLADVIFNITFSLIGSQMQAYISEALGSLELQASNLPTTSEPSFGGSMNDNEVLSALSNFGRGRHVGYSRPLPGSDSVRSPMTGRRPPRR